MAASEYKETILELLNELKEDTEDLVANIESMNALLGNRWSGAVHLTYEVKDKCALLKRSYEGVYAQGQKERKESHR